MSLSGQIIKIKKSANLFNKRIDAIFAYIEHAEERGQIFTYSTCLSYLNTFDNDLFGRWQEKDLVEFIQRRGSRKNNAANYKATLAASTLDQDKKKTATSKASKGSNLT